MSINKHDLGDLVRVYGFFSDPLAATAIDPDVVNLSVCSPDGEVTPYVYGTDDEVVNEAFPASVLLDLLPTDVATPTAAVGQYHSDIDASASGLWSYRWWSTGDGQAAEERSFLVREARAVDAGP